MSAPHIDDAVDLLEQALAAHGVAPSLVHFTGEELPALLKGERIERLDVFDDVATTFVGKAAGLSLPERAAHLDEQAIILDHWRGAFDALDALRVLSVGIGLRCDAEAASPGDQPRTRQALTPLFWAAHLIASEVLTLLRHGYAAGAFARWRALYEIDVRAQYRCAANQQRSYNRQPRTRDRPDE